MRFVSAVLPTLGESRIAQTTFDRLLGPSTPPGSDEPWLGLLDRFEAGLCMPAEVKVGLTRIRAEEVAEVMVRVDARALPYRERRKVFVDLLASRHDLRPGEASRAAAEVWPTCTTAQALRRPRTRTILRALDADEAFIDAWLASDGAARSPTRSGHASRACPPPTGM
ncbi:hypothetical protein BH23ACT2_BH23ACT2_09800 [soil metagenome]